MFTLTMAVVATRLPCVERKKHLLSALTTMIGKPTIVIALLAGVCFCCTMASEPLSLSDVLNPGTRLLVQKVEVTELPILGTVTSTDAESQLLVYRGVIANGVPLLQCDSRVFTSSSRDLREEKDIRCSNGHPIYSVEIPADEALPALEVSVHEDLTATFRCTCTCYQTYNPINGNYGGRIEFFINCALGEYDCQLQCNAECPRKGRPLNISSELGARC